MKVHVNLIVLNSFPINFLIQFRWKIVIFQNSNQKPEKKMLLILLLLFAFQAKAQTYNWSPLGRGWGPTSTTVAMV